MGAQPHSVKKGGPCSGANFSGAPACPNCDPTCFCSIVSSRGEQRSFAQRCNEAGQPDRCPGY
jgi:hypothetical protein